MCRIGLPISPTWPVEKLLEAAERTGAWMVSPYLSTSDYPAQRTHYPLSHRTFVPEFLTFNLNLISLHCLKTVGYLDEQFKGCFNDVDYTLRIRQQGGEVAVAFCGEIMHLGRGTLGDAAVWEMYKHELPAFEAKWPGVWNPTTGWLGPQRGLKRWLVRVHRVLPGRFKSYWLDLIHRLEPIISRPRATTTSSRPQP
jgi:GT2 family glycosyltransferase